MIPRESRTAAVLDSGFLYAVYDASDAWHERALALLKSARSGLVVPSPVIPEVDHLLGRRLGRSACEAFYRGLAEGFFHVADLPKGGYARVAEINAAFADLKLGFVDAAVVAIAEFVDVRRIATTDLRDFRQLAAARSLELVG